MHFSLKIRHLVETILMIFLRVLPKIFLWPHYSAAPGARGPRFIEPPEPPVPTPLMVLRILCVTLDRKSQCTTGLVRQIVIQHVSTQLVWL